MSRTARLAAAVVLLAGTLGACATSGTSDTGDGAGDAATDTSATPEESDPEDAATDDTTAQDDAQPADVDPDLLQVSGTTLDGEQLDLASLAGEPVVLWFWAPWCTVCRGEAPDVAEIADDLDGEVTFVGVPGLGEPDAMQEFVDTTGTEGFTHLVDDDGTVWNHFGVVSQPSYVFVSPDGTWEGVQGAMGYDQLSDEANRLAEG
ncbi:redoxin domain-containing protein [Cellulosimicrobium arenosum]|uniref:Redoxin domain-containing protein n=1 Tax=Cellulosimicrobium arenosum TaxID=2708133 RepID=A0A927G7A3_9MICO|nr:redoxin domain-containing protein [Cellulosimicrobium arenosum]MBD8078197.1 redoxin domain-containing protein [Cellulosimicrobium arenosum]